MRSGPSLSAGLARTLTAVVLAVAVSHGTVGAPPATVIAAEGAAGAEAVAGSVSPAAVLSLPLFATNLDQPVAIASPKDGSGRVFVVEKPGRIRVYSSAGASLGVFLDIRSRVNSGASEQGLLGLAFHPAYKTNGRFYVSYTDGAGALIIAEYRRSTTNRASLTERRLLKVPHPVNTNHNGGNLAFGPDGYLYISTGDGGSGGDPPNNAQNRKVLLGKILRIAPNVTSATPAYRIPSTNPYATSTVYRKEIWAYGLRNTWRFSFDRTTGDLWLADVGQDTWEEVDHARKVDGGGRGRNYGWHMWEGNACFHAPCTAAGKTFPVATYAHVGGSCAITGGYVYRGTKYPALQGKYIFGDYCSGKIWWISAAATSTTTLHLLRDTTLSISAFGEDEGGELYLADLGGHVYRLKYN